MSKLTDIETYVEKVETIKKGLLLAAGLTMGDGYLPRFERRAHELAELITGGVDDLTLLLGEPPEGVDLEKLGLGRWGKVDQDSDLELWLLPAWFLFFMSPKTVVHDTIGRHAEFGKVINEWRRLDDYDEVHTPLDGYAPIGFLRPKPDCQNFLEG